MLLIEDRSSTFRLSSSSSSFSTSHTGRRPFPTPASRNTFRKRNRQAAAAPLFPPLPVVTSKKIKTNSQVLIFDRRGNCIKKTRGKEFACMYESQSDPSMYDVDQYFKIYQTSRSINICFIKKVKNPPSTPPPCHQCTETQNDRFLVQRCPPLSPDPFALDIPPHILASFASLQTSRPTILARRTPSSPDQTRNGGASRWTTAVWSARTPCTCFVRTPIVEWREGRAI